LGVAGAGDGAGRGAAGGAAFLSGTTWVGALAGVGLTGFVGAAFFAKGVLAGGAFLATAFLAAGRAGAGFFRAGGAAFAFFGTLRAGVAFLAGAARLLAGAAFLAVFLTAVLLTDSPRNGGATLVRKARREGRSRFGRRGL
jgi:hypothetical protein